MTTKMVKGQHFDSFRIFAHQSYKNSNATISLHITENRKQKFWSTLEKEQLHNLIRQNTVCGRVQWPEVARAMPNRTINQCKTQYRNVLKEPVPRNHQWTCNEMQKLITAVYLYGKKWNFIKKTTFPDIDAISLRLKYSQCAKFRERHTQLVNKILVEGDKIEPKEAKRLMECVKCISGKVQQMKENERILQNGKLPTQNVFDPVESKVLLDEFGWIDFEQVVAQLTKAINNK